MRFKNYIHSASDPGRGKSRFQEICKTCFFYRLLYL